MESPVDVAMQFVRSEVTKKEYRRVIRYFLAWAGLSDQDFVKRAGEQPKWAESIILNFIGSMTKRGVTPAYTALHVAALKSLLDYNDVTGLNWKKLKKAMPSVVRHGKDRAPTVEEIRRILSHCGLRERAVVLAMASGGFRVGAWPLLQLKDFSIIKDRERVQAGRLLIYRGEPEEYVAFLTPEAVQAFEAYFEFRRQSGEGLNPSSPLIRDSWDTSLFGRAEGPHPMSLEGIRAIMLRVLARAGLKEREFKQLHGFRKFFKTRCEQSVKSIYVEMLMGHSLGISNSYMKTPEQELLTEYLKAVPSLTIQEADELKRELSKKDEDIHKLGTILEEIRFRVEYPSQRERLNAQPFHCIVVHMTSASLDGLENALASSDFALLSVSPKVFHPYRIIIMKVLALHGAVEFRELKAALDLTDGNLASHLRALEGEGLIVAEKGIVGKRMRTTYVMTESGRAKFRELTSILEGLVK